MTVFNTITVTTATAVQLPVGPLGTLAIINPQATNKIFLGSTSAVSSTNGVQLPDGGATAAPIVLVDLTSPVWAIATIGNQAIGVISS